MAQLRNVHSSIHNRDLVSKSVGSLHGLVLPPFTLGATSHNGGFCQEVREAGVRSPSRKGSELVNLWLHGKERKQWGTWSVCGVLTALSRSV